MHIKACFVLGSLNGRRPLSSFSYGMVNSSTKAASTAVWMMMTWSPLSHLKLKRSKKRKYERSGNAECAENTSSEPCTFLYISPVAMEA